MPSSLHHLPDHNKDYNEANDNVHLVDVAVHAMLSSVEPINDKWKTGQILSPALHHLNEGDLDLWNIIKYKHPPCDPIMKDVMLGPSSFVQRWWSETGKSGERLCFVWERSTTYDARWKNTWEHRVTFVHVYVRFCLFACRKLQHSTDQWSQAPPTPSQELHLSPSCLCCAGIPPMGTFELLVLAEW